MNLLCSGVKLGPESNNKHVRLMRQWQTRVLHILVHVCTQS